MVFDFDSTIIECDSDNWVLDETGLTEKFYQLLPSMPWNPLMVLFSCSHCFSSLISFHVWEIIFYL